MGRSDAGPLGRSDAERGVGRAGVLHAPAKPRGAGRGVWVGAGVPRGGRWVDGGQTGCPARHCHARWGLAAGRESEVTFPTGI